MRVIIIPFHCISINAGEQNKLLDPPNYYCAIPFARASASRTPTLCFRIELIIINIYDEKWR